MEGMYILSTRFGRNREVQMVIIPASVMSLRRPTVALISLRRRGMYTFIIERYYVMSGETLEDYFRSLSLDETRRKYLEDIKDGKQVDMAIQEHFKNGNVQQQSLIAEGGYSTYMNRFLIHRHRTTFRI
jgi:hypothetical protein